jgi:Holliday junction DNA helicase RuvA
MIGFLRGTIISSDSTSLIIDVGGVGYKVACPLPVLVETKEGDMLSLFIHTHVREDQITLFGFKEKNDIFLFEKLTSVSGIGPKSALSMLSVHSPSSLASAIEKGDSEALSHTPGIGKRTSEKIIIELKGKLSHLTGVELDDEKGEARLALESLGYTSKEIHNVLQGVEARGKTTSTIIKEALQKLQ